MQADELYGLTDELLNSKQQVKLKVGGYSMFPYLRNGDEIIIDRCPTDELKAGDIIVFRAEGKWIAHRLHRIILIDGKKILTTKGDSCRRKDHPLTEENIVGKVISFFRKEKNRMVKPNPNIIRFSWVYTFHIILLLWFYSRYRKIMNNTGSIYKSLLFVCRKSKRLTIVNAVTTVFQGILPFVIIYLFKWLIDGIWKMNTYDDKTDFIYSISIIIGLTGLVFLLNAILNIFSSELKERLSQSVSLYIHDLLHQKYSSLDMAYLEDANYQDKIHRAVQEAGYRPLKMINESFSLIQSVISWIVIALILLNIHWSVFILILVAVIPGFWVRYRYSKKLYHLNKSNSQKEREAFYYNRILTSQSFAKEIRLFGTGNFFSERFSKLQKNLYAQKNSLLRKRALADVLAQAFAVILIFFSFGIIIQLAIIGKISIGTVVLFFFIFQRGYSILKDFFQSIAGLYEDNVFLSDFFEFLRLPELRKVSVTHGKIPPLQKGIFIEDISFQYPSSQRKALSSLSIEIPAGKTVALVGPNGSGKTTLVKLLCRFYTADKGNILFDDTDIASADAKELRKKITAVFQDFALYNMTAAENIFLGDLTITPSVSTPKTPTWLN